MTEGNDVFISYSHGDAEYVEQLAERLQRAGVSVWYDEDIGAGRRWRREIEVAIETAQRVLVVLSPSSVISDYVRKEISYAEDAGKDFLPLLLEAVDIVPLALNNLQWIDAREGSMPLAAITEALSGETDDLEAPEQLPEPPETLELRLRITGHEENLSAHVSLPKLGIDATPSPFSSPLNDDDLRELRWYLEQYPRWPAGPDVQRARRIERQMEDWGRALFNAVFSDAAAARIWQQFRDRTDHHQVVTLDCDESAALRLPWELLADEQGHLSSLGISVRRRLQVGQAAEQRDLDLPLRILMVVSRPEGEDIGFIDPRASSEALLDAVEPLGADNCQVEFLDPPTLRALRQRLVEAPPVHVVHFDGHGVYDRDVGLGYLLFEDEDGKPDLGAADRLGNLLVQAKVPLMILDACQSADIDAPDPYSSVAARLIRSGVGAVLAMQYSVLVAASQQFFAAFYGALASGATVGQATDSGRQDLLADTHRVTIASGPDEKHRVCLRDWFLPALYERRGDPAPFAGALVQPDRAESREDLRGEYPDPTYDFVGRGRDLWKLERSLHERRIVVLHGFGGQGKTALAVESGKWLTRTGRFERAAFLSFEHGGEADSVVTQLGRLLCGDDFSSLNGEAQRAQLKRTLSECATLIIWDNFESLLEGGNAELPEEALKELLDLGAELSGSGDSRLVLTTRDPNLPHATFTASSRSTRQRLGGLTVGESLELAGEVLSASGQERPEREELERLLGFLGGHPLSIQLVLPRLEECGGVGPVINRFEELYPGFTRGKATERNESLEVSLKFSLDRLSEEVRERLPALGVFRGGGLEVQILRITGIEPEEWQTIRSELTRTGLATLDPRVEVGVEWEDTEFRGNYLRFHPTLAPHLRGRLEEERRGELEERYRRVYHDLSAHLQQSDTRSPAHVRAIARREMPNLRRALDLTLRAGNLEAATDMAARIERFLNVFGRWRERGAVMDEVENAVEAAGGFGEGPLTKAEYLHRSRRGEMLLDRGRAAEAGRCFHALLERFDAGVDYDATLNKAQTLGIIGRSLRAQGQPGGAEREYRRALAVLDTMDQDREDVRRETGFVHTDLADALRDQGRYAEARPEYLEGLNIQSEMDDERAQAVSQGQLGTLAMQQRDYEEARLRCAEALEAFARLGETRQRAIVLHQLGMVAEEEAKRADDPGRRNELLEEAEARYRESVRLEENVGNNAGAAQSANQLAIVAEYAGRPADAERWYGRTIDLERNAGVPPSELAKDYNNLANLLLNVHRMDDGERPEEFDGRDLPAEAEQWARKARRIKEDIDDPSVELWKTYGILAGIADVREDVGAARAWRRKARRAYAAFPGHWANLGKLWGPIARDFGRLLRGELPEERAGKLEAALKQLSETEDWSNLVAALRRVQEGARDADALAEELGLRRHEWLILTKVLAAVVGQSVWEEPDRFEEALRAFAPLLHAVLSVCEGNQELRPDVNEFLDGLSQHEGPREIVAPLRRVLEGERDRDALCADLDQLHTNLLGVLLKALDGDEEARSALQQLAEEAGEEPDRVTRAIRNFAPLLRDVVRICEGNGEPRAKVEDALEDLGQQEDWEKLAPALRQVLQGESDRETLTEDLDEIDSVLIGILLDALAGEEEARSRLEVLCEEAQEDQDQQRQQIMQAFQQWLQSPAGKQAREQMDTADMSEEEILQSLFQHFIRGRSQF